MKKSLLVLILLVIIPFKVNALSIEKVSISGTTSTKSGEQFNLTFNVNFYGLDKEATSGSGLYAVCFDLEVNNDDFKMFDDLSSTSKVWDNEIEKYENSNDYVVCGMVNGEADINTCKDDYLYCSNYSVSVPFFTRNTSNSTSTIKMKNIFALGANIEDEDVNAKRITSELSTSHMVSISKIDGSVIKEPESNIGTGKANIEATVSEKGSTSTNTKKEEEKKETEEENTKKSSNTFLKTLKVEEYNIDFSKEKRNYDIYLDRNINSITVTAKAEKKTSTVEIIGADNLKDNEYKVLVNVKSEDDNVSTYTINVKDIKDKPKEKIEKKESFYKKHKKEIVIGGSIVVALVLIIYILNFKSNKKIDKALKF